MQIYSVEKTRQKDAFHGEMNLINLCFGAEKDK